MSALSPNDRIAALRQIRKIWISPSAPEAALEELSNLLRLQWPLSTLLLAADTDMDTIVAVTKGLSLDQLASTPYVYAMSQLADAGGEGSGAVIGFMAMHTLLARSREEIALNFLVISRDEEAGAYFGDIGDIQDYPDTVARLMIKVVQNSSNQEMELASFHSMLGDLFPESATALQQILSTGASDFMSPDRIKQALTHPEAKSEGVSTDYDLRVKARRNLFLPLYEKYRTAGGGRITTVLGRQMLGEIRGNPQLMTALGGGILGVLEIMYS